MADNNPNPKIQDPGVLGNTPESQGQADGQAQGSDQGTKGLSEADVRRIALQIAQSTASKAENRVNQNVQGQVSQLKSVVAALVQQNPNLKLSDLSDEQIRNAQRSAMINSIADRMLSGEMPEQNAQAAAAIPQSSSQDQGGQQPGAMNLTQNDVAYLKLRAEEIFAEEGVELYAEDPEAADLDTSSRGRYLVSLKKAVQKKSANLKTNPQARIASQGTGSGGTLISQFQTEKAKLPRGQARPKLLQELRMKYQKLGVADGELN